MPSSLKNYHSGPSLKAFSSFKTRTRPAMLRGVPWLLSSAGMGASFGQVGSPSQDGDVAGRGTPVNPVLTQRPVLFCLRVKLSRPPEGDRRVCGISSTAVTSSLVQRAPLVGGVRGCERRDSGRGGQLTPSPPTVSAVLFCRFPTSSGAWGSVTLVRGGILGGEDESGEALLRPGALPGHLL